MKGRKPIGKLRICPHGIMGKINCPLCKKKILTAVKSQKKREKENPEMKRIYNKMASHPEHYQLADKCFYVGKVQWEHEGKLEHGHVDYKDEGFNYVTVCRKCNMAMDKDARLMRLAEDYVKILKIGRKQAQWIG